MPPADFRPLFEENPNPITVVDPDTQVVLAVNEAACHHFGCTREELIGREVASLRPAEDAERWKREYERTRGGNITFPCRWRHLRKDGTILDVDVWRMHIEFEGRPAFLALVHDITARRRAEESLRESEERYRLLFAATPVPIFVFDADSLRYLAVNDAAVTKYGYSREEFMAMTIMDIRPHEDVTRLQQTLANIDGAKIATFNLDTGIWRHQTKNGATFDVEIVTHAIDFAGRPARLVVASDVTARRRVEEQLRQSQKMEATGLLAGGVAHDFNNLLGVVLGAGELARRAAATGQPTEPYLAEIEAAGRRAAELTRKLLAFSRKQVLRVRPLDLGEMVADFLQLLSRVIGEDVELDVERSPEPLIVSADVSQLEQVLLNLCTNARQAMPTGGRIVLETRRTRICAEDVARKPWAIAGDWAEIRIVDTGVGMDAATRARIFEPFFTTKSEGTGLGLSMVHGIVHQHRGFVHVESRPRAGTTVRIFLPVAVETTPRASEPRVESEVPIRGGRETLLVAEDEPPLRRLLATTLSDLGYEVIAASNGEEAARAFEARRGRIALAILDVVMPQMGGVQAYERMRAINPELKVIFMTGYAPEHAQVSDILGQGGRALLLKPFALNDLGHKVRETLDGRP